MILRWLLSRSMRVALWLVLALASVNVSAAEPARPTRLGKGETVLRVDFNGPTPLKGWQGVNSGQMRVVPGRDQWQALAVDLPDKGSAMIRMPVPLDGIRGARLKCRATVKADGVAKPANPWSGIKAMLHLVSPEGERWEQRNDVFGTFDWKPVEFIAAVPKETTRAELMLGLEATSGRVWFERVELTVAAPARTAVARTNNTPPFKGHSLDRLRGVMIGPRVDAADLRELGQDWRANHVRWQIIWGGFPRSPADKGDLEAYDGWLETELQRLRRLLPVCVESGLLVLIDLHTPPGGRNDANDCRMFHDRKFQEKFVEVWDRIARRFRDQKGIWGYDLVNEPCEGTVGEGLMDWQSLATHVARRVREIDPKHAIIVEPAPWGGPSSLENLEPIPVRGVVYSVHMYLPHQFTHQGVYDHAMGLIYPGMIEGRRWDKNQLRRALQPAVDFQRAFGVHLYIGEFSAIRWAPDGSAHRWLNDVIDLMEENAWDWAYHAFREWQGWSVEHGADKSDTKPSDTPTDRETLLRRWFSKNEKPSAPER